MINFSDPPPLYARVHAPPSVIKAPAEPRAPVALWVLGAVTTLVLGIVALMTVTANEPPGALLSAVSNTIPSQASALIGQALPPGTRISTARAQLHGLGVRCRSTPLSRARADSLHVCIAQAVIRGNAYSRMMFQLTARADTLTRATACPALIRWSRRPLPNAMARRIDSRERAGECWRDTTNIADNEWAFAVVPDRRFAVALVHGSDTLRRQTAPSPDTLVVLW